MRYLLAVLVVACGCAPGHTTVAARLVGDGPGALVARARWPHVELNYSVSTVRDRSVECGAVYPLRDGAACVVTAGWMIEETATDYRAARVGAELRGPFGQASTLGIGVMTTWGNDGASTVGYVALGIDL